MNTMSATAIKGIDIHVYRALDSARAIKFWRDVMGLRCTWESDRGAEFELPDGATFGVWKPDAESEMSAGGGIMFAVGDLPAAVEHYRARGVRIEGEIEETPICYMAFAVDSEGNSFILHHRKDA
jgi:predicted enzyme related to lactoylglutathione lyase